MEHLQSRLLDQRDSVTGCGAGSRIVCCDHHDGVGSRLEDGRMEKSKMNEIVWTPATEQLPKAGGYYLTTVRGERGMIFVDIDQYYNGRWPDVELAGNKVLAWAPLPEPWEE